MRKTLCALALLVGSAVPLTASTIQWITPPSFSADSGVSGYATATDTGFTVAAHCFEYGACYGSFEAWRSFTLDGPATNLGVVSSASNDLVADSCAPDFCSPSAFGTLVSSVSGIDLSGFVEGGSAIAPDGSYQGSYAEQVFSGSSFQPGLASLDGVYVLLVDYTVQTFGSGDMYVGFSGQFDIGLAPTTRSALTLLAPVPEPRGLALLLAGIVFLIARRMAP